MLLRIGAAVVEVVVYLVLAIDVVNGVWTMSCTALELLVTAVMISIVVVMGSPSYNSVKHSNRPCLVLSPKPEPTC